jgi:RimJ/RimL family protein N-acetyltransferase
MIEGKRINLRAREEEDTEAFHRWFNDPDISRLLGRPFPAFSMSQQRAIMQHFNADHTRHTYSIMLKTGDLIGNCELRSIDWPVRSCELAIVIGEKQYWGQGYGVEVVTLLLRIAFDGLNMHKVWLTCAAYNERGLRAYRRAGFREDGRLRDDRFIDGCYHDTLIMSVLAEEWRAAAQK